MLPAGIASALTQSSSQPVTQTPGSGRTGRLRGLSYLRHYAHGHHHTQHSSASSSGSAPPAAATSGSTALNSNSTSLPSTEPQSPPTTRSLRQRRATAPLNNTALNSWIPTVSGVSGLSRVSSLPTAGLSTSSVHAAASGSRQTPSDPSPSSAPSHSIDQPAPADLQQPPSMAGDNSQIDPASEAPMPSIRFTPYIDMRSNRESLRFAPIERCLRTKDERIKVGRASDRDSGNPYAPVGFGSKVVSRRHCEFWCENGQWFVKDVKSSSGTFLNHIRLSAPGMESKAFPLNDGDILQLGIDFKGGEEQIFRCVKIRVELNRAWQKGVNNFKYAILLLAIYGIALTDMNSACLPIAGFGISQSLVRIRTPALCTPQNVQSASCKWR
jgi:pSer/pThr/pTyr-binding forkhead associated (FHA) protein